MSNILVPVSDFAALITRLEALEAKVAERLVDGVYRYGPCLRCGYGPWDSSSSHEPRCCPRCHSAYWNTPPKRSFARTPEDPPLPRWDPERKVKRRRAVRQPAVVEQVVEATSAPPVDAISSPALPYRPVILPPELRPPGEPLIPPPPRIVVEQPATKGSDVLRDPTTQQDFPSSIQGSTLSSSPATGGADSSSNEPVQHVAALPDAVVEAILDGQAVTYEEIKAAKGADDADGILSDRTQPVEERPSESRRTDPALQAKKDAFFADAIAAGLVSTEPAREADEAATPFVTDAEPPSLAPKPDDDPFWK